MRTETEETPDDLHARYLEVRKPYKSKAEFLHSDMGPTAIDFLIVIGLSLALGFLMQWRYGIEPLWGFVPIGIAVFLFRRLARRFSWKTVSFRSWYLQRYEPVSAQHQALFHELLTCKVPPATLESWTPELFKGRATQQLAGYKIVYDATENHFYAMGAGGFYVGEHDWYEALILALKEQNKEAGLCSE